MGTIIKNGISYSSAGGSGGSDIAVMTRAEYDALVEAGTVDNDVYYFITDAGSGSTGGSVINDASDITYDNSTSGLTATDIQSAIDEINGNNGGIELTYDSESGYPKWRTAGTEEWHFFKHRHIGSAGVPDETLTDDTTLTEPTGCFTKIQYKYHTHSSSCYTEQKHGNMHVVDDNGAVYWQCSICGATQSGNATDAAGSHPCYNTSTVLTCGKTEGKTVEKTYYVCDCGKLAGSYTTKL